MNTTKMSQYIKTDDGDADKHGREVSTMEGLQKALVVKIDEQLKLDKPNIQYLDVLNRLLGTVNNFLLNKTKD